MNEKGSGEAGVSGWSELRSWIVHCCGGMEGGILKGDSAANHGSYRYGLGSLGGLESEMQACGGEEPK